MSGPEIKNMMMAALGWSPEQENEFEEKNPEWPSMIDAVHGVPEACKEHGDNPLGGMKAKCDAIPNEQFINCVWYPV
jgi:hypothetical protein